MNEMSGPDQARESVDDLIKVVALVAVKGVDGIERILHINPAREAFFVYESKHLILRLLKVIPNPRQGFTVQNFNLQDGAKNKADVSLKALAKTLNKTLLRRVGPDEAKTLLTSAKVAAVLHIDWQRPSEEPAVPNIKPESPPETELLSCDVLAKRVGTTQTCEDWEYLLSAVQTKQNSAELAEKGITLKVGETKSGAKKIVIVGEATNATLQALMADRDRLRENSEERSLLGKFLKTCNFGGLAFKGLNIKPAGETARSQGAITPQDVAAMFAGVTGEDGTPKPEVAENKEQACVTVFVEKFNQEILRDTKGRLKRNYSGADKEVLLENFFLEESDLVLEIETGIVMLDFSSKGVSKLKSYWLGAAEVEAVKMKWYQFKANINTQLATWKAEGIEFDFSALVNGFDEAVETEK